MKIEGNKVIFSTGKARYANRGIIGLHPNMGVSEGYDGWFYNDDEDEWRDEKQKLSKTELIELADYMIEQWQKFRSLQEYNANDTSKPNTNPGE